MWSELMKRWLDMMTWWLPNRSSDEPTSQAQSKADHSVQPTGSEPQQGNDEAAESAQRETGESSPAAADSAAQGKSSAPGSAEGPDEDLTAIKGIGPSIRDNLTALGIRNFQQLAAADAAQLSTQLREQTVVSQKRVQQWIDEARSRAK